MKKEKIIETIINDFKKIIAGFKKLPCFIGIHAFLIILILVLLDLIFGIFVYYKYIYLVKIKNPEIVESQILLDEKKYQQVLEEWKKREEIFNGVGKENLKSPFK